MTTIQPVETKYAGCRFRSRLEARWAVFFDHLGIEWLYEPERYMVGPDRSRRSYLADFYLPTQCIWVEVKGDADALDMDLMISAAHPTHGIPLAPEGHTAWVGTSLVRCRVLLLGPVPREGGTHEVLTTVAGGTVATQRAVFTCMPPDFDHFLMLIGPPFSAEQGRPEPAVLAGGPLDVGGTGFALCEDVRAAYVAARSARFEHGETGVVQPAPRHLTPPAPGLVPRQARRKAKPKAAVSDYSPNPDPSILKRSPA